MSIGKPRLAYWLWVVALFVGSTYWLGAMARSGVAFAELAALPPMLVVGWKALATGLLIIAAWCVATSASRRLLAVALTLIWCADIFLASGQTIVAGTIFVAAHLLAAVAYIGARRRQSIMMLLDLLSIPMITLAIAMAIPKPLAIPAILYAFLIFSSLSAAAALASRFPVALNGLGGLIFACSDILFVVGGGWEQGRMTLGWLIWLCYFAGLALLVRGLLTDAKTHDQRGLG